MNITDIFIEHAAVLFANGLAASFYYLPIHKNLVCLSTSANPVTVFGKFLASAASILAEYSDPRIRADIDGSARFIHVLGIKSRGGKPEQYESIEKFIRECVMPIKDSRIDTYNSLYGMPSDFEEEGEKRSELIKYIEKALK